MTFRWQSAAATFSTVVFGAFAALAFCHCGHAAAVTQFQKSVYTAFSLADCRKQLSHVDGAAYLCPGLPGFRVYVAEGDGRTFLSAGYAPENAPAANQTLTSFNTPFVHSTQRATIEWRFVIRDGRKVPYATIMRYFTHNASARGEVLVVMRVQGAEACHVAYIDALANNDPIVLARKIADERARTFNCATPATIEGKTGVSPM